MTSVRPHDTVQRVGHGGEILVEADSSHRPTLWSCPAGDEVLPRGTARARPPDPELFGLELPPEPLSVALPSSPNNRRGSMEPDLASIRR